MLNACTIIDTIDIAFMRAQGVNLVCGAPRTAMQWLAGRTITPHMPLIQVSGAKLSDADAALLLQSFDTVEDVYGSSETSKSFVNVKTLSHGRLVTRGQPLDSEVQIIDAEGKSCTLPGSKGTVRIRNGYMASAYIAEPQATEKAFRDGWFYPGDSGWWGPAGELVISGRLDEIINLGGEKVDPSTVDEVLCSVRGITGAASFRDPRAVSPPSSTWQW